MAKVIKLDNEFSMESDGKQWTIRYSAQKETNKDGVKKITTSKDEWYCGSTSGALKTYVEKALLKAGAESSTELLNKIEALHTRIEELWISRQAVHAQYTKGTKFAVDPPESADEEEDEQAISEFEEESDVDDQSTEDVLGDLY